MAEDDTPVEMSEDDDEQELYIRSKSLLFLHVIRPTIEHRTHKHTTYYTVHE